MTQYYTPEFVETFPTPMAPAVLYISIEYNTCGHLCACGCGNEVVTPLSPAQWSFAYDGKDVSVWPSVGNWGLPCRAHYVITRGRVEWAREYNDDEVALNRGRDRAALDRLDKGRAFETQPVQVRSDPEEGTKTETRGWLNGVLAPIQCWRRNQRRR